LQSEKLQGSFDLHLNRTPPPLFFTGFAH